MKTRTYFIAKDDEGCLRAIIFTQFWVHKHEALDCWTVYGVAGSSTYTLGEYPDQAAANQRLLEVTANNTCDSGF